MVKNSLADARDAGSIPRSGRSPGVGNGNPPQYFLPGKFHGERSLVGYSSWGHKESDRTERVHTHAKTKVRPEMPTEKAHKESTDECLAFQIPRSHSWWNQVQTLDVKLVSTNSISSPRSHPKQAK